MKIKMNETYAGSLGLFIKNYQYDLPLAKIKELTKAKAKFTAMSAPQNSKAVKTSPQDKQFRPEKAGKNYKTKAV
jgi:hypothetical protein